MNQSLHELPNFVDDAFVLKPARPYFPENTVLGFYTFLPWVRIGIAQAIVAAPTGIRAGVHVMVPVQGGGRTVEVGQDLLLRGPGDVLALKAPEVIRTYPQDGHTKVEDSFLVHIEFDRPDYPWIFSPMPAQGARLDPFVALVVVRQAVSELLPAADDLPPRLRTTMSELQPLEDNWAWAHAQIAGPPAEDDTTASVSDRLTDDYGPQNLSRLLCPRRLAANEQYLACVVPAFDAGVKAGCGSAEDGTLARAWTRDPSGADGGVQIELPSYYGWRFSTGPNGDFLSLAEQLVARSAPWPVGRRLVDTSAPGGGLDPLQPDSPGRLQTVLAPLFSPQTPDANSPDPVERAAAIAENAQWPDPERSQLVQLMNQPDALAGGAADAAALPLLGPELYGRHQAARTRVAADGTLDWFDEINLRPVDRVVAGLGTRVIQHDQEQLMQSAWAQVGAVDQANSSLRQAELARFVGESWHSRYLGPLPFGPLLQITRGVHARVKVDSDVTLAANVRTSNTAAAAVCGAFRRLARPTGVLARWVDGTTRPQLDGLLGDETAPRDFRRDYRDPDGVVGVAESSALALAPDVLARHLDLPADDPAALATALVARASTLATTAALPDAVTPDAVSAARPAPGLTLRAAATGQVADALTRTNGTAGSDPTATLAHLSLLKSVGNVPGDVGARLRLLTNQLNKRLPTIIFRPPVLPVLPVGPPEGTGEAPASDAPVLPDIQIAPDERLQVALKLADTSAETVAPLVMPLAQDLVTPNWPGTPPRASLTLSGPGLLDTLHPARTLTARMLGRIGALPNWLPPDWFADGRVRPVMAAPTFNRPMYQALNAVDPEWLIPGMALMPEPDLVTMLVINARFVEAFLIGLSHEMGRELLWRSYPTDQAGTYFRRFFNAAADDLASPIHQFQPTGLGTHLVASLNGRVVLLVRGELLRRYPDAVVLAMRADHRDETGHPMFSDVARDPSSQAAALFHGRLPPDVTLVGFALTLDMIRTEDWWFVIAEHPTAPRFGLAEDRGTPLTRDSVAWADLPAVASTPAGPTFLSALSQVTLNDPDPDHPSIWGSDAATGAHILLRNPVRAAFDARKLLGQAGAL